ncbi:mucin-17-like [Puntigrus tetrazona]|uniref:mucin-17-like n=1 Tax=Puntigrus tetrazona TaxID=1606681 RepID=UPI001C89A625|nr:mucin-17-like [Puntigrus tetrazona]
MRFWWLPMSLLTVVMHFQLQKAFITSDSIPCQEILCQDWTLLQTVLRKQGYMCRCFIVKCVYIAEVRKINHMPCIWLYRGHHKKKIQTAVLPPKLIRSLLRGKMRSLKQGITSKTCLIIGAFHVKRKSLTKLDKQPKDTPSCCTIDHHSSQTTDGFLGDAFEDTPERRLRKQVSDLAKMLSNAFPSATWLRMFINQKGSTICPINQATRYSPPNQGVEIKINDLVESTMKFESYSNNDAVVYMEKILVLLGMRVFQTTAKDSIVTAETKTLDKVQTNDSIHRHQVPRKTLRQKRSIRKPRSTTVLAQDESKDDDKMTSTMSFSQTVLKPHNAEGNTKDTSITVSFKTEHTEKSEFENPATSRKYANTVTLTKQQMGITTVLTETDCTTELERPSAENEGSEKKISSGGKEIRTKVEAVQNTAKFGQKHQASFGGNRLTVAKATLEKENSVSDINDKLEKENSEQREDWIEMEKPIMVTSQPDNLMTKASQTNKPVTATTSRGNKHTGMLTEKETGITTALPETECTTEIELQTPEDKTPVERTDPTYGEKYDGLSLERLKTKSMNELLTSAPSGAHENTGIETEHEETTTELHETECITEIEALVSEDKKPVERTDTTFKESQSEPVDLNKQHLETEETNEQVTPNILKKNADSLETEQDRRMTVDISETECTEISLSTAEQRTSLGIPSKTTEERLTVTNESAKLNTSTKYTEYYISTIQEILMTTETLETECTTEIELQTPEDKTPATRYEERLLEPVHLITGNSDTKGTDEPVTPMTSTKSTEDFILTRQETLMTRETLETECTTEIDLQTPEDKTPVMTTTITYENKHTEPVHFSSENTESQDNTPINSIKYADNFISTTQETFTTTKALETECTTEIELQTLETPVERTDITHEKRQSKYNNLSSEYLTKSTNEPAKLSTSTKYAEDFVSIKQETLITTETLETECTTEIELQTPETPVMTTTKTYEESEERLSEPVGLITNNIETKVTNEPVTPVTSTKSTKDFMLTRQETLITTELPETECTTEIKLQTPEDKATTRYDERLSEPDDFISRNPESKSTNAPITTTTSIKYADNLISTRQETLMTIELPETECTTEIELQTPEDKTPVMTTATRYEERETEPVDFISENTESKGTNALSIPTNSILADNLISTRQETLMTTDALETECTTEIQIQTPEDKTTTRYEERLSEPENFISRNTESKSTNAPITTTTSIKYADNLISTRQETLMTTDALETECTTEIELQTPEDKTPVERTDITHEERQSEYNNLSSEYLTKSTNESAKLSTSTKYADLISTTQETLITTETLETECTTEIELQTPETPVMTTTKTYEESEERLSEPIDLITNNIKVTNEPVTPVTSTKSTKDFMLTRQETLITTELPETECTTEIKLQTPEDKATTRYDERLSEPDDFISRNPESKGTNAQITTTMSIKYEKDFTSTRLETLISTETSETGLTKETELQTPEDKTPVMTTATRYEERLSEPENFISRNTESKGTNAPITTTTSIKYADNLISTRQETLMTIELPETECTTEIELQTPEDKTPVMTTATRYEERETEPVDFISENTESKVTNALSIPTNSILVDNLISTRQETLITAEALETECTTEIELQTPEDKTPGITTALTYEERETEPVDFISENTESKVTNAPVTPATSIKYADNLISTKQETLMKTETLETECTTEIELQTTETPETPKAYEERLSELIDLVTNNIETKVTNEPVTPITSTKSKEDLMLTRQEILMTTELPQTECTTEITLQTPENKTPVENTDATERHSEHDVTPTEHEITLVLPDTGCTIDSTEKPADYLVKQERKEMKPTMAMPRVETQSPPSIETEVPWHGDEDGCTGLIHRTNSGLKRCQEKIMKIFDLKSEHLATEGTNELVTATKYTENLIRIENEKRMTTQSLETECITEIELQTPEDKTPVMRTDITHEERQSEYNNLGSEYLTKSTNEPAKLRTSTKYAEDFISTKQETLMTTETLETECTTEIELPTPGDKTLVERTDITHEERQLKYDDLISEHLPTKDTNKLVTSTPLRRDEHTVIETKHQMESITEVPEKECTKEIEILIPEDKKPPSKEAEGSMPTDEDGCFGLIHRTSYGMKRCQEKMIKILLYNTTPKPQEPSTVKHRQETTEQFFISQNALQSSPLNNNNNKMDKVNDEDENSHFYYFNGKLKRVENHALIQEHDNNTYTEQTIGLLKNI